MIYWPQGQWGGVRARYCAPVHSYAVKWSRNTKWKMTVDRLFTSRHQASFKMGLIASPCSWSWFKVLTSISWCPACCRDMFQKGLSTATESAVTLSTVREMMYFTKTKRSYFRFAPPPTPESPRQDRFKVLPTPGPRRQPRPQDFSLKRYFLREKPWGRGYPNGWNLFLWLRGDSNRSN